MQEGLVSVIMPTFNCSEHLAESIDSILTQTYADVELVITDDHSTDPATLDILRRYARQDSRVSVLFLDENKGPGYARDQSIARARGRYIAFCDSDDRWQANKLERQLAFMAERDCALCFSSYLTCDEANRVRGIVRAPASVTFGQLKRDNCIGCLTAVYDTRLLGRKYFMPVIRKRQDWGLFLSILRDCGRASAVQEPLAYYRVRKQSVSSRKLGLIRYNVLIYRQVLGFSRLKAWLYFAFLFTPAHLLKVARRGIDSFMFRRRQKL